MESVLLAGGTLSTLDSISESRSVIQVTGLLAGGLVDDSGLVWPTEMVSEGAA
jgi:hypothetical protein